MCVSALESIMAYDCIVIDFNNTCSDKNLDTILKKFPYATVVPFVDGYFQMLKSVLPGSRTMHTWVLTTKIDYNNFDFEYMPEQHQITQLHAWANSGQKEGDTFLIPKAFLEQDIKFLRDYKDINYHTYDLPYDFDFVDIQYNLANVIENIPKNFGSVSKYIRYYENSIADKIYPSYWEDLKIY